jgi:hypothetical protein
MGMYNAPPPNLMQGIQLIESGRKAEALPYLRYAVQNEVATAEGWLWLAAATDDLEEYRYCIDQALRLDPFHPTAQRMRNELERLESHARAPGNMYAAYGAGFETGRQATSARHRPSRLRRLLRALVLLLIVGGCVGGVAALIASGVIQEAARDWLAGEETHTLEFTVGGLSPYRFRVEMPGTWLPADTDDPSWRDKREKLMAAFPPPDGQTSVWEQVETSFSRAARDPVYGEISPPIRLVETDVARLEQGSMVAALTLLEIVPYPSLGEPAADVCAQMRLLEQYFKTTGELAMQPDSAIVETALTERQGQDDCIFVVHRRYTNQTQVAFPLSADRAPTATRAITLAVPVGIERYALWQITFADSVYDDYERTIERIFDTLVYQTA